VKKASTPICLVNSCLTGSFAIWIAAVLSQRMVVGASHETPRSANNQQSQTISEVVVASALSSASALERDTAVCFLDFHAIREVPRKRQ